MNVFTVSAKLVLGRQTETGVATIQFPIKKWIEKYGSGGTFHLWNKRSQDTNAYPVTITSDAEYVYWVPTSTDLAYAGYGEAQLDYTFGTAGQADYRKACSEVFQTRVEKSVETGNTTPAPYAPWVSQVESFADRAEAAAEDAEDSAEEAASAATTAVEAKFSALTAEASTLSAGSSATASYNTATNKITFGIPKGDAGTTSWNGITDKPSTFPPSAHTHDDRYYTEAEVNTLLDGKADSSHNHTKSQITDFPTNVSAFTNDVGYLTQHQSLSAYRTASAQDTIDNAQNVNINAKYTKPSGGIPSTDMTSAVQTSLAKADSATQTFVVTFGGTSQNPTCDKTFAEITAAINAGYHVVGIDGEDIFHWQMEIVYRTESRYYFGTVMGETAFITAIGYHGYIVKSNNSVTSREYPLMYTPNGQGLVKYDNDENVVSVATPSVDYLVPSDIASKENTANKVTSLSSASTDTQYPSAKCVYDLVGNIESALAALR